ncbi:hypothetical protein HMPREF1624_00007 [Sporothrix schenckii ATCC 58251]|uniref:Major facilitator superfamily (MFS) profile domain-containing protein n=1 Tax=Sporothrix schenckii (strain ATCC 58251 / de Perez 2211183) TaxID=1391915 RepID=U7Q1H6_SPOS1|nr:hypothetical protein HMPREF1624_00007 [Sporothrix schenckii ATCC 58251]
MSSWLSRLAAESGLTTVLQYGRDAKLLCAQRFVRLFAYGASFLVLVPFLASLGIPDARIGLFMTLTMLGDVGISLLLTAITDQVGRRLILAAGTLLMASSGVVFALSDNFWVLLLASIVGVISPSGNEIGPFRAVEESVLAQLTPSSHRSDMFAWYTLFGTAGTALGSLASGTIVQVIQDRNGETNAAYRIIFFLYAAIGLVKFLLTLALTSAVEAAPARPAPTPSSEPNERSGLLSGEGTTDEPAAAAPTSKGGIFQRFLDLFPTISHESRGILSRLVLLFALDSFASGMASPSWITYFFITVHSLAPAILGTLFLVTNIFASFSNLLALPLARRLGPLKTMAFTHLPSALFLGLVPVPPASGSVGTPLAMAFLALRACTQSMDQAPRQAFLSAAVLPAERTAVMGVVNTVKTLMQAGGVGFSGVLAGRHQWILLLGGAGALKASYDLLLLWNFSHLRPRQEEHSESA